MRFLRGLATTVASVLCLISTTQGSSQARNPLNYLSLVEDPQIHTHNQRVNAYSHFELTFDLHKRSQHIRLRLEPNHDIIGQDSHVNYLDQDGNIERAEKIVREDHKVYQGQAYVVEDDGTNTHVGWSRIVVRRDGVLPLFQGAFTIMGDHHNIQLKSTYMSTKDKMDPRIDDSDDEYMIVYRDSDVGWSSHSELRKRAQSSKSCGADHLTFNTDSQHPIHKEILSREERSWGEMSVSHLFGKRQTNIDGGTVGNGNSAGVNLRSTIGDTSGCPSSRQVALVGIATDCGYTSQFDSNEALQSNIVDVVNTASDLYQSTFNITLGLRNLTVSPAECPATPAEATKWNVGCSDAYTITSRLNDFSTWRGSLAGDTNAYWSLFTTCNTGAEVGLAWLGQLCNHGGTSQQDNTGASQTVTGANVVARTNNEWQVFAHESGHTFGAVHDCDSSACQDASAVSASQCCPVSQDSCDAGAQYMMNPYSAPGISKFSPCSVGNICSALGRNSVQSTCLTNNRDVTTITGQSCGNGIVEGDEDCDCGGPDGCAGNACCNPMTCKFNTNAVCDPTNEGCCTTQCQFASANTVCRASTGECDPQETCSGTNATCPPDTTEKDGNSCGNGLQCASGQCTSRDLQCKTVMGSYTEGNDTYSCNSQSCTISCASPDFGLNTCYSVQQNFLDGTTCGGGGHCDNGVCRGSTVGGEVSSWIDDNKTLVIALASAIGGLLLLAILGCCIRACKRKRRGVKKVPYNSGNRGWNGPPIPPQMQSRGYGGQGSQNNWYPQAPPPSYGGGAPGGYGPGGNSVRYA
ncbi:hypothetical protein PMZ80_003813 [Knufia obscura]|uniref:Disintegrin and metalloproteinase domain-containing protein B n=2 Tax=Knufia TaxID=430999 RepID=A0AAN8EPP5_9EURO|nr:hypothetical protein PMZ80_003813 [Knufia obscura]KAK5958270.1 hypothetical protein OHC33_000112 [Knufia fluminis]